MSLATALFSVSFQLLVTTTPPILLDNLGEGGPSHTLRVDWNVRKVIGTPADECTVQVYNLDAPYRKALEGARRSGLHYPKETVTRVQLAIGWGGVPQVVFVGELISFEAGRQEGADVVTTITALTGGTSWRVPPAGGSEFGLAASAILITEAARLGHIVTPAVLAIVEQQAAEKAITVWKVPGEKEPKALLDWLFGTLDLTWGISSKTGAIAVYKNGVRSDLPVVGLSPTSGLLTVTASDEGVEFEALAQTDVEPGGRIQLFERGQFGVTERPVGVPLRVESVEFLGSSHGQSTMRGVARSVEVTF